MKQVEKSMKLRKYDCAKEFWRDGAPFLLVNEAENNLMISIIRSLLDDPTLYDNPYLGIGTNAGGDVAGVALMTPPHNLLLGRSDASFMRTLCQNLGDRIGVMPGVNGPDDVPGEFCDMVTKETGRVAKKHMSMRTFKLTRVEDVPLATGAFALANAGDKSVLASMIAGFVSDARVDAYSTAQAQAERLITQNVLYVWRDESDQVVSMAGKASGDTPNGERIGWVYTPPHLRGRGYATSVVASLSRQILQDGKAFCFLFTDLSNPTSNKIYRKIGYEPICDFNDYRFRDKGGE
jgi:predicted GNAT family acetyltransferase